LIDIVFVHGLRGTSHRTWAKSGRSELFWPKAWLPDEEEIRNARISTFGYDADFLSGGTKGTFTITDFAKDLLFELPGVDDANPQIGKVSPNLNQIRWHCPRNDGIPLTVAQTPVIFIAHSMGGLVVKKASCTIMSASYAYTSRHVSWALLEDTRDLLSQTRRLCSYRHLTTVQVSQTGLTGHYNSPLLVDLRKYMCPNSERTPSLYKRSTTSFLHCGLCLQLRPFMKRYRRRSWDQ
jgi:hypothetical protein